MSFPVYVSIGALQFQPHLVFEGLAYLAGFQLYLRQRRRCGEVVDAHTRWSIVAAGPVTGMEAGHGRRGT